MGLMRRGDETSLVQHLIIVNASDNIRDIDIFVRFYYYRKAEDCGMKTVLGMQRLDTAH